MILNATSKKFADDTKVAKLIRDPGDAQEMQLTIDNLTKWAETWGMSFNAAKCKILHVGKSNPRTAYFMDGERLGVAEEEKDLGVWVTTSMKPSKQCTKVAQSANFALGQIQRAFHYRRKKNLIPLYKSFVRPRLEFAVAAWSPWLEGDVKILEKVQERLIRMVSDVRGGTYEEKLKDAGLTTLKERRRRGDLIEIFKTMRGINKVERSDWFEMVGNEARSTRATTTIQDDGERRREWMIKVERANLETRRNFFTIRAAKEWNDLPDEIKESSTVNSFKSKYDRWISTNNLPETADRESTIEGRPGDEGEEGT